MELALRLIGGRGPNTCTPVKLFVEEASIGCANTKELALGLAAGEANPLAIVGGLVEEHGLVGHQCHPAIGALGHVRAVFRAARRAPDHWK